MNRSEINDTVVQKSASEAGAASAEALRDAGHEVGSLVSADR